MSLLWSMTETYNMENPSCLERMGKGVEKPEEMPTVPQEAWGRAPHIMISLDLLKLHVPSSAGN